MISNLFQRNSMACVALLLFACEGAGDGGSGRTVSPDPIVIGVVIPATEGIGLLKGCSGPEVVPDSLWTPSSPVLGQMEARLAERLREVSPDLHGDPLQAYARQYFGLYRNGRAIIFINGVHEQYLRSAVERDSATSMAARIDAVSKRFRTRAVNICDGGRNFFRAEYDVTSDTIVRFTFNGLA